MALNPLFLVVIIPILIAGLNCILPLVLRKILALLGMLANGVLIWMIYQTRPVFSYGGFTLLSADQLAFFALLFSGVLSLIILIYALKGVVPEAQKKFFVLFPLTLGFCNGAILSIHPIAFILFWGLSGLTLFLFAILKNADGAMQSAKKTMILVGGSDAFLIMGVMILMQQSNVLYTSSMSIQGAMGWMAFIFLLVAAFAKAGGFPFHTWVPDFCQTSAIESAAFLPASLDKLLGIYLLARMVTGLFVIPVVINLVIVTLGALTVITAVMMAMHQHSGRKLLGYHAVSQVGYMIMGIGSGHPLAFAGGLFHLVNHTIYKSNLFLCLGSVEKQAGSSDLDSLGGLGVKMKFTFVMAMIGAFSISGIPPFNGFFSKWMIYQGLFSQAGRLSSGLELWLLICIVLALFGSGLTLASFLKFLHAIFLGRLPKALNKTKAAPFNQKLATGLLSLLCVGFGLAAMIVPLKLFIVPILQENGLGSLTWIGLYHPLFVIGMMFLAFLAGYVIYRANRRVREDEVYLGGKSPEERFRVLGPEFYNEIRKMNGLRQIYDAAEKKLFDIYDQAVRLTMAFSGVLQKAHPGSLHLYILYFMMGLFILLTKL